ncbi:ciliogenesis-associated TTC17-interacting protein-like [Watersipora subatra]|uniref:ciliogenesis-associated TTC17-interacting protein-like n=1 Tax=Watersipora subatra TaxID=2589382 RepID=UPI00355C856F
MALSAENSHTALSNASRLTSDAPINVKPEDYPQPTEEALEFIETIIPSDYDNILFGDELTTISESGRELGEFIVSVTRAKRKEQDCFLVHANSEGTIDGVPCGTSVTAYISKSLDTLEQQHHEYVKLDNLALDKKTTLFKDEGGYQVSRVISQGERVERSNHTYPLNAMKGFISEGSNLLLLRLMVTKGLPSGFQAISFDSDGNLCKSPYTSLGTKSQTIAGEPLLVSGIQREIESLSDLTTTWHSHFDRYGHLTSRVQVGSPAIMRVMKMPEPVIEDEFTEKPTFSKEKLNWEDDAEMYSRYLDRKEELEDDHSKYTRQHPELKCILADFLQFLLLRKPEDTLNFAGEYFASFSTRAIDIGAYASSSAPTPFPPTRTNTIISLTQKLNKKQI